jgi:hypothetical protein
MKRRAKLVGFFILSMWAGITCAVEGEVESAKVSKVLTQLFDRPNSRLTVDAVAVASDHSLASWSQAGRGGRALLKRVSGKWQIVVVVVSFLLVVLLFMLLLLLFCCCCLYVCCCCFLF